MSNSFDDRSEISRAVSHCTRSDRLFVRAAFVTRANESVSTATVSPRDASTVELDPENPVSRSDPFSLYGDPRMTGGFPEPSVSREKIYRD